MESQLGTTNLFLGVMAAVSVLQALVLIGAGIAGYMAYRKLMTLAETLEERHVAPAMARVNTILDDVKVVSVKVREEAERVDNAIQTTIDRVDDTVDRVRWNVRAKTSRIVGVVRGVRLAIETLLQRAA
jgi:hypothetical protein